MNNINEKKAEIWCTRFNQLMKEQGYTQKSFLKEYKNKYGGGTQANISRWLRVGNVIQKNGISQKIGFPSYENMLNIADFFGVTVGYLTGETIFKTFEMEKACQCIGIDIKYEIKEELGTLSESAKGWKKELNLVSWNGAAPKYDLRDWSPEHEKMGKGITLSADEVQKLYEILKNIVED